MDDSNPAANINGKCMIDFLNRTNLTVDNALDIYQGVITISRKTISGTEKSVLDLFLVCRRMRPFITRMVVGENGYNNIFRFTKKQNN